MADRDPVEPPMITFWGRLSPQQRLMVILAVMALLSMACGVSEHSVKVLHLTTPVP